MIKIFLILVASFFAGCVTTKPVVPALQGKPLIKINEQAQAPDATEPIDTPIAPAPDNKDTKESSKHVRKKTKGGDASR